MTTLIKPTLDEKRGVYVHPDGRTAPRLTSVLREFGFFNYADVPQGMRDFALDRGSKVHRMTALWDKGTLNEETLDPQLKPYLDEYKALCADFEFQWDIVEESFLEPVYWYATTLDRFGRSSLGWTIAEVKTGDVKPETDLQVSLQLVAIEPRLKELGIKAGDVHRIAIELRGDGKARRPHVFTDHASRNVALGLVSAYHWKKNRGNS